MRKDVKYTIRRGDLVDLLASKGVDIPPEAKFMLSVDGNTSAEEVTGSNPIEVTVSEEDF